MKASVLPELNSEYFDKKRARLGWRKGKLQLLQLSDHDSHVFLLHSCAPNQNNRPSKGLDLRPAEMMMHQC